MFLFCSQLKRQAAERQCLLQEARRLQSFQQQTKELQRWVSSVQERLLQDETATDVASAVELLEQHQDLQLEMEEQMNRYCHVVDKSEINKTKHLDGRLMAVFACSG